MPLEGFSLLAKPAMRPQMLLRALRPPMILGASLPGMIFPAQRPAEGSNSYHYGSYATMPIQRKQELIDEMFPYHYGSYATKGFRFFTGQAEYCFHTTMVLTQRGTVFTAVQGSIRVSIPLWFLRNLDEMETISSFTVLFPYHYGSYAT